MTDLPLAAEFPAANDAQWRQAVTRALKGADFDRKLVSRTADGIVVQPLYPKALGATTAKSAHGPWRVVQRVDMPSPVLAREQALQDLDGGADALALAFAGSRAARGHGLQVETVADLDQALDGVMLDLIHLRIEPSPAARVHSALVAALIERRGHAPDALDISFGLDPIGLFAGSGMLSAPFAFIARRNAEAIVELTRRGFKGPFVVCDGRPPHEAGGGEAQELAFVVACGVEWLRALESNGVALDAARRALGFTLAADTDEFLTIAKMRALRRVWARVEEACGLAPQAIRLHAETAWRSLAKRDPHVNLLRGTIAAFSAGVGGADSVAVLPFTNAIGLPDAFARRLARNAQLILIEEANLAKVADPAAGAGGFEALTNELAETAWRLFQQIETEGEIVASLAAGRFQERVAQARAALDKAVATRRAPLTGVSEFPLLHDAPVAVIDAPPPPERRAARQSGPRLDFAGMIASFAKGAPRGGFAPAPHPHVHGPAMPAHRLAEPFEALRDHADTLLERNGSRPRIFLANLGGAASFTARAMFAKNLFEAGGIEAIANDGFALDGETDLVEMTDAFKASGAHLVCVCGSDDVYHREAVDAAMALAASGGAAAIFVAGRPADLETQLRAAGVTAFVYLGCDAVALLADAQAYAD